MFSADGIGGDDAYAVPFSVSRRQWGGAAILYGRFRWAVRKFFLSLRAKSVRIMDLKYVRSELQKLSEIIDSWNTRQETAALERDLVLEKLRKLYDAVRFGADADFAAVREDAAEEAAAEPAPTEIPVSIDLGEILPLDPFAVEALPPNGTLLAKRVRILSPNLLPRWGRPLSRSQSPKLARSPSRNPFPSRNRRRCRNRSLSSGPNRPSNRA